MSTRFSHVSSSLPDVAKARGVLLDVLALVLCPKGRTVVPEHYEAHSKLGFTGSARGGKVQEL